MLKPLAPARGFVYDGRTTKSSSGYPPRQCAFFVPAGFMPLSPCMNAWHKTPSFLWRVDSRKYNTFRGNSGSRLDAVVETRPPHSVGSY